MNSNPSGISVVIPAYNVATTIGPALDSVVSQTRPVNEIVIVDDGSTDDTVSVIQSLQASLPIVLIQQANQGAGAARNRALSAARFSYVAFLDADDEWLPEHIERSVAALESGGHMLVAHNEWIVDNGREQLNDCARRFNEDRDPYITLYRKGYISTSTVVARRQDILASGGFDESLRNAQDFDLWLSVLRDRSKSFLVFDDVLARYHIVAGSIMSHVDRRVRCCRQIALRHIGHLPGSRFRQLAEFALREIIVYREAFNAHRKNGARGQALLTALVCPFTVAADILSAALSMPDATRRRAFAIRFLWVWVLAGTLAYLYQFKHLTRPIWNLLTGLVQS